MAFLFACPCKNCDHAPTQHADLLDAPCATDHCTVDGCHCEDYEPSCGICDGCRKMDADLGDHVRVDDGALAARTIHVHQRLARVALPLSNTVELDAEWKRGELLRSSTYGAVRALRWTFQAVTRVDGFEVRPEPSGELLSIRVGDMEQLMTSGRPVSVVDLANPRGPEPVRWLIGPIELPTLEVGAPLTIVGRRFDDAEWRPFGRQLK